MSGVYFREFPDGTFEIGVLDGDTMDVGDFAYYMPWNKFDYPFIWIGYL